jgi:tetratricopeptide (TPR) repeat protein
MEDDVIALRETMNYMYQDETIVKRIPTVFTKRKFYYYAAASAALLIATGGLVQRLSGPEMNNSGVFDKYYAPYEVTVTYRSGNTEVDRLLLNALERYEEKDYEYALVLFEEVLESRQNDMAVNLYSGISYMEEEKYQKATTSFSNIIADKDNLFIEQAKWYLAMCYLKTEKAEKAQDVLKEIINEESYYKEQAARVLKDIGN